MANGTLIGAAATTRAETVMRLVLRTSTSGADAGSTDGELTGPCWHVPQCVLTSGRAPSWARGVIALAANAIETMPSVVGSTVSKKIKGGTQAKIITEFEGVRSVLMTGHVVNMQEDLAADVISVLVMDHRYVLAGIPIMGSLRATGESSTSTMFVPAAACVMNPGGKPNCCKRSDLLAFCPPSMGLQSDETPSDLPTDNKACYWTLALAFQYFQQRATATVPTEAPWLVKLPDYIIFSDSLGAILEDTTFDVTARRKAREMNFEGMTLDEALQSICEMAGPFALALEYHSDGWGSTIKIVDTKYNPALSFDAAFSAAGDAATVILPTAATTGLIESSVVGRFTRTAVLGAPFRIERRFTKVSSDDNLEPAWSYAQQDAFIELLRNPPGTVNPNDHAEKFRVACQRYPTVFCAWRIRPAFDFQAGTDQAGRSLARIPRAPEPRLYTSLVDLSETDLMTRLKFAMPVLFEVSADGGTTWFTTDQSDGFEIDEESGVIFLPGLRKESGGAYASWSGTVAEPDGITKNRIRATLVVPTDHRLAAAFQRKTDSGTNEVIAEAEGQEPAWEWEPGFVRCNLVDAGELYQKLERKDSYPEPEAVAEASFLGQPISDIPVDDTNAIKSHARRRFADVCPPAVTCQLGYPHIFSAVVPGASIRNLRMLGSDKERRIMGCVRVCEWRSDEVDGESTLVSLG